MKYINYIIIGVFLFIISACEKDNTPTVLTVSKAERQHIVKAEGDKFTIRINTNTDFELIVANEAWCHVSFKEKDTEGTTLNIQVDENVSEESRNSTITLRSDGRKDVVIIINQLGVRYPLVLSTFEPITASHGTIISLKGDNFGDSKEAIKVYFNDVEAEVLEASKTEVKIKVPKGLTKENDIIVEVGDTDRQTYSQKFIYQYIASVFTAVSRGDLVPAGIAVDENRNIVYTKIYESNVGIYRINQNNNNEETLLMSAANAGGECLGTVYDKNSGVFYINIASGQASGKIVSIDTKNGWLAVSHAINITNGVIDHSWKQGLILSNGMLYTRYGSGEVVKINPTTWKAEIITKFSGHSNNNETWGIAIKPSEPNRMYFAITGTSEIGYIDISQANNEPVWLNSSTEKGYYNAIIRDARINEARFMCSDNEGILYLVDQSNHAIRMITSDKVETFAGGNGWGDPSMAGYDGLAKQATFGAPMGICTAPDGSIYVADTWARAIRHIVFE